MTQEPEEHEEQSHSPHLTLLRPRANMLLWSLAGIALSSLGLFFLTGWAASAWLFLLYPMLIGIFLCSLGVLALHLLRRF
jgi:hypothetical protein